MSSQYFSSYSTNSKSIKIKLDLSNYATEKYLKDLAVGIDISSFTLKSNLADLKTKVDKIDFERINSIDTLQGKNLVEQNYLVFESKYKYFKTFADSHFTYALSWESKGLSSF